MHLSPAGSPCFPARLPSTSSAIHFLYGLSLRLYLALCILQSIFPSLSRSSPTHPPLPLPVSPLSVDFSTSETKQTESCVSGLVTQRAPSDQRSCVFICPPSSTFSTFLRQAPVPFPLLTLDLTTPWNGSKNEARVHQGRAPPP